MVRNYIHFKARNFRGVLISPILNNFWISRHLSLAVHSKYQTLRHFNFTVWPKYYNLRHFSFAKVLKVEFFTCVSFQNFRNFEKNMEPKWKLKYELKCKLKFSSFFTQHWFTKVLKSSENLFHGSKISSSSASELTTGFINPKIWRSSSGVLRGLHNKIIIDYNKTMKSNDFRHLCDNMCNKEVSLLCFVKFVALVFCFHVKKNDINKQSEVPAKKELDWV